MSRRFVHVKSVLDLAVTLAMGAAAVFMIVRMWNVTPGANAAPRPKPPDVEDISGRRLSTSIRNAASVGRDDAQVVLIEYSDFECPFCARHAGETYEQIDRGFVAPGRVQYVFRHFPIERIHASALAAARAAVCAQQQDRFMEMRTHLFANQKGLAFMDMNRVATTVGLNGDAFTSCLVETASSAVEKEKREASRLGVSSTPTFFIGRRLGDGAIRLVTKISGALDYSYFKQNLDTALGQQP